MEAFQAIIILYILTTLASIAKSSGELKFSRDLQVNTNNTATSVPAGFHLYTIATTNKTLRVNSSEPGVSSCTLAIDPFEESIQGNSQAVLFNRKNQIILWGLHAQEANTSYFSLLTINPKFCIYNFALQVPDDDTLKDNFSPIPLPRVFGQEQYGFLVFFPSQRHCWPCRFNGLAEILEQPKQLEAELIPSHSFHLQLFDQDDADDKTIWFYANNFPNNTAVIKLIDRNFNVTRRAYVNFKVQTTAANQGIIRNSGVCSTEEGQIVCRRLDSKLRVVQSIVISVNATVSRVSLEYDSEGNSFVTAAVGRNINVFIYNVDGQFVDSLNFGQIESGYIIRELRGYITLEQRVYHYCVFLIQEETVHARHSIKCIPINEHTRYEQH